MDIKRRGLALLSMFFILFYFSETVFAVPGELNYQLIPQQNSSVTTTTVITDTKALDECNRSKMEIASACQKSNSQLLEKVKELQGKVNQFTTLLLMAGVITFISMMFFIMILVKKSGSPPPPPPVSV